MHGAISALRLAFTFLCAAFFASLRDRLEGCL